MSGYNEDAYKQARQTAIALPCPFERALLSRCVNCYKARRLLLAEREVVSCTEEAANATCIAFSQALHHNARFALHIDEHQPWPFGKEIRAECGGVLGLQAVLGQDLQVAADVSLLVDAALTRYGAIDAFPYSAIMRGVVHFEPRKRR
jgi:hypothetical protein